MTLDPGGLLEDYAYEDNSSLLTVQKIAHNREYSMMIGSISIERSTLTLLKHISTHQFIILSQVSSMLKKVCMVRLAPVLNSLQ